MNDLTVNFSEIKESFMEDEKFKSDYEKLKPRYDIISEIIKARKEKKLTQEELAFKVGTRKSNISRLESGSYNPSLDFLIKIAEGLDKELKINMK